MLFNERIKQLYEGRRMPQRKLAAGLDITEIMNII
jgi:hypothetical protein